MLCVILGTPECGTDLEGMGSYNVSDVSHQSEFCSSLPPRPPPTLCTEVVPATSMVLSVWPPSHSPELKWVPGLFTRAVFSFGDKVAHSLCSLVRVTICLLFFAKMFRQVLWLLF